MMDLPVLITLEDDAIDNIYAFLSNPMIMFAVVLTVAAIVLLILWLISRRGEQGSRVLRKQLKPRESEGVSETPALKRLRDREARIREMESSVKSKKMTELEGREKNLLDRQTMEHVEVGEPETKEHAEAREPETKPALAEAGPKTIREPAKRPVYGEQPTHKATYEAPPETPADKPNSELAGERDKLKKMIEMASEKYEKGEMDKEAFTRLETDYYKKLIDLEIRMREEG